MVALSTVFIARLLYPFSQNLCINTTFSFHFRLLFPRLRFKKQKPFPGTTAWHNDPNKVVDRSCNQINVTYSSCYSAAELFESSPFFQDKNTPLAARRVALLDRSPLSELHASVKLQRIYFEGGNFFPIPACMFGQDQITCL